MTDKDHKTHDNLDPISRVSLAISYVAMLCLPVIVVAVGYEVVMRYGFSKATSWVTDLSVWLGAIIYVIAGLYAMQQRAHIAITLIHDWAPPMVRLVLEVIALVVVLVFSIAFIAGAGPNAWDALMAWERVGTTWNPPIPATVKPLIVAIVFLIALQAVANFVVDYRRRRFQSRTAALKVD